mgnify:CR=1 FL=1
MKSVFYTFLLAKSDRLYKALSFERNEFSPFGLRSNLSTWTELLNRVPDALLHKYVEIFYFVDDLLNHASIEQAIEILNEVFKVFRENGLIICPAKAVFIQNRDNFLGYKVIGTYISQAK